MKHSVLKCTFITLAAALCSAGSAVFADVQYDCTLVAGEASASLTRLNLSLSSPLNNDDAESAMVDLKAYCCQQGFVTNGCESVKQTTSNPESPWVFDQFVSRGFFKLDNKIDGSKDTKGTEWATAVQEWTDSGNGKVPVGIQNKFVELWEPTKRKSANVQESTCEITNYDSLHMSARYYAVCKQAACITRKFFIAVGGDFGNRFNASACEDMTKKRINDEMTYVQTLMVRKANRLMEDTWDTYTKSYLLENRWSNLLQKMYRFNESFSAVNGKVQEGTRMCSAG